MATSVDAGCTVAELARKIEAKEVSCLEVADHYLDRIERFDGRLGAFSAVDPERVRAEAVAADAEILLGRWRGPLHGIPVAVKDLIFVKGLPMSGGSMLYRDFVPDEDDASVARLRAAGAVIAGKTSTAEFGFSANQTATDVRGETRNPWDLGRSPGGSSGGSAAAVAAGLVPVAVGSDGGGSIRIPSSFCGLAGLKPTFGRVPMYPGCRDPRWPGLSGWESVEHVGPIARDSVDAALLLDAMSGPDRRDRHSLPEPADSYAAVAHRHADGDLSGLRIGWLADWGGEQRLEPDVRARVTAAVVGLEDHGAAVEVRGDRLPDALGVFALTVALDADPSRLRAAVREAGVSVNPRILEIVGQEWGFSELVDAQRRRRELFLAVAELFDRFDVLVTPTVPVTALPLGEQGPLRVDGHEIDPGERPRAIIGFTYPFNLTGHPAMSVPCGFDDDGLPVGVQLIGDRLREDVLLRVAAAVERDHPPSLPGDPAA